MRGKHSVLDIQNFEISESEVDGAMLVHPHPAGFDASHVCGLAVVGEMHITLCMVFSPFRVYPDTCLVIISGSEVLRVLCMFVARYAAQLPASGIPG